MAKLLKKISRLPFAPIVAGIYALAFATLVMAAPAWIFEALVVRSGIDQLVSAAAPPLGMKARVLLALIGAGATAAIVYIIMKPVARMMDRPKRAKTATPVVNVVEPAKPSPVVEADEANGLGRRRPLLAREELGAPFMSDEALDDAPVFPPLVDADASDVEEVKLVDQVEEEDFDALDLSLDQALDFQTDQSISDHVDSPLMSKKAAFNVEPPAAVAGAFDPMDPYEAFEQSGENEDNAWAVALPDAAAVEGNDVAQTQVAARLAVPELRIPVAPPVVAHSDGESLRELVTQLEQGIDRRSAAISATQAAVDSIAAVEALEKASVANAEGAPSAPVLGLGEAQAQVDGALKRALETLDRLAASGR